jgi:type II secretory pathway pseudopilin PulG
MSRLRSESGMTLVELLVTAVIGMVVLFAMGSLLDASGRASAGVQDRVDALQRGRTAIEYITQRLRSQVCLSSSLPAVAKAEANEMWFYTDLRNTTTAAFAPEARKIRWVAGATGQNGSIVEDQYDTIVLSPAAVPTPIGTRDATFGQTPSRTRTIISDVALAPDVDDRDADLNVTELRPLFDYYRFIGVDPATPNDRLISPLAADQLPRVVRIAVAFDARPSRASTTRAKLDSRTETDVFVRTADPTDPDNSPSCL